MVTGCLLANNIRKRSHPFCQKPFPDGWGGRKRVAWEENKRENGRGAPHFESHTAGITFFWADSHWVHFSFLFKIDQEW